MEQLRGVHRAQRVGREVTEPAVGPVDILHAAVAVVVFGGLPEPGLHFFIPQGRDIVHLDLAVDQRPLNLIAQHHVCRVAHFVRIDADIARLHALVPGE